MDRADLVFEWDEAKSVANAAKHGIYFEDVIAAFSGPVLEVRSDRSGEVRWKAIGMIEGVVVAIVYTPRRNRLRLISARRASRHEREAYERASSG